MGKNPDTLFPYSIVWTVPIVLILAMRYSYDVEKETSEGDPVEVILADKFLIITGFLYFVLVIAFVYSQEESCHQQDNI